MYRKYKKNEKIDLKPHPRAPYKRNILCYDCQIVFVFTPKQQYYEEIAECPKCHTKHKVAHIYF